MWQSGGGKLLFSGRPKAAGTALGVGQFVGRGEGRLPDRGDAELGHALAGLDGVGFIGQIPSQAVFVTDATSFVSVKEYDLTV